MKAKELLKKRKKEILEQIKPLLKLQEELDEINQALSALEPQDPKCGLLCTGCAICRRGEYYR